MMTWGHDLPLTREERRRRANALIGALVGGLVVVGLYAGSQAVSDVETLRAQADSLQTYKQAVEELTEREELSMAYLAEHHPQAERELRARTKLWGKLP